MKKINPFLRPLLFLLYIMPLYPTKIAKKNFSQRLLLQGKELKKAIYIMYQHYIYYILESFIPPQYFSFENKEAFKEYLFSLKEKRAGCLTYHLGNIEALGFLSASFIKDHKKVYAVGKNFKFKFINKFISFLRKRNNLNIVWNEGKKTLPYLEKIVAQKEMLVLVSDQKASSKGFFISFLGQKASFPVKGPSLLLQGEVIFFATSLRLGFGRFRIYFKQYEGPMNLEELMKDYVLYLEEILKEEPYGWFWDYDKWSRKE